MRLKRHFEVHKIEGFSKYHNFKFEVEGIRAWRAYGVELGRFIPYREVITEHQGPNDLIVHENFFYLKESMFIKIKATFLLLYRRIFVYTFCLINICLSLSEDANKIKTLNIERA